MAATVAELKEMYADPWYQENMIGPMNRAAEQQAKERAQQYQLQAKQLALQGRVAEANIANQKAQIELRKAEMVMQANMELAKMRGPGNWAQYIDAGRRMRAMGMSTSSLAQIANGGVPTGAFAPGGSMKPVSQREAMSGMMGASQSEIDQRHENDKGLAAQIASRAGQLARGSLESLTQVERDYLGSYAEEGGFDWNNVQEQYKRAGIHQGRR